jgi:hypothetical protein
MRCSVAREPNMEAMMRAAVQVAKVAVGREARLPCRAEMMRSRSPRSLCRQGCEVLPCREATGLLGFV